MKNISKFLRVFLLGLCLIIANSSQSDDGKQYLPIIPGGDGFGSSTPAGSGRHLASPLTTVYRVSNLNAAGPGSFQDCVYAKGPRTCVFEVSGTIDLTGDRSYGGDTFINLKNPYITIAGQTAPSPGITIKGKTLRIEAHDVLIQHLRFRVGDSPNASIPPGVRDALLIAGRNDRPKRTPHNIVIDHCSFSWGIDEVVSIKDSSHSITLSNNIISEGLDRSLHPKGRHSKGLMAVGNYLTIKRNLLTNLNDRAPLDISPNSEYVNNLTHNAKYATFSNLLRSHYYTERDLSRRTSIIGNVRSKGSFRGDREEYTWGIISPTMLDASQFYITDNRCTDARSELVPCVTRNSTKLRVPHALHARSLTHLWSTSLVQEKVLSNAGARPLDRDSVDQRLVREVIDDKGKVPDCVSHQAIYYPSGEVLDGDADSLSIAQTKCYAGRFEGQTIEVDNGNGNFKARTVLKHLCDRSNNSVLKIDRPWPFVLEPSARFRIKNSCINNAGGWPTLKEDRRALTLPKDFNRMSQTGYTHLEDYLHSFYPQVEP